MSAGSSPNARAACPKTRAAERSSEGVCEAIAVRRSRDVFAGTVGGTDALREDTALEGLLAEAHRLALIADDQGTICISISAPESPPRQALGAARVRWSAGARRDGDVPGKSSSAASAPATAGGPGAVEKISERAVLIR